MGRIIICMVALCLCSCAHISKDGRTFYGLGKAKRDAQGNITEIESSGFLKDVISLNMIKGD